jgi:hypothetical protein
MPSITPYQTYMLRRLRRDPVGLAQFAAIPGYTVRGRCTLALSPATVAVYLAAVRSLHIDLGLPDTTQNAQGLRRVMKGIQRCVGSTRSPRLPLTSEIMQAIFHALSLTSLSHDSLMFWSASCVAYFGFLRVMISEFKTALPFNVAILSGGARYNIWPSICVGRWQSVDSTSS